MPRKKSVSGPPVAKRLFTKREAAEMLGISERSIDRFINLRKIGAIKIGAAVRIPDYEVERVVNEGTDAYYADVYGRPR